MLRSADAYECELGAIIARYVAEDVALHSDEVFADKVRDLLGGMTQTIGEVTRDARGRGRGILVTIMSLRRRCRKRPKIAPWLF